MKNIITPCLLLNVNNRFSRNLVQGARPYSEKQP